MSAKHEIAEPEFVSDLYIAHRYMVSRATVWRWVKAGKLPAPLKIGLNTTRWRLDDVLQKMEAR